VGSNPTLSATELTINGALCAVSYLRYVGADARTAPRTIRHVGRTRLHGLVRRSDPNADRAVFPLLKSIEAGLAMGPPIPRRSRFLADLEPPINGRRSTSDRNTKK
jgi:hypothetical protein